MNVTNNISEHKTQKSRSYSSPLRAAAALETRRRIVGAAAECFTHDGYAATTMRAIARSAGVSVETVNGHGPKRDLLFAAFELAFSGTEGTGSLAERADFAVLLEIENATAFLGALTSALAAAFARADGIWRALTAAADVDPAVREALDELQERRRGEFALALTELRRRGVEYGDDQGRAIDILSFVLSPESYHHMVALSGWPVTDFEHWALRTTVEQLAALVSHTS